MHSALALPACPFRPVVHHPVTRSLATPLCSSLSGHACSSLFCVVIVHSLVLPLFFLVSYLHLHLFFLLIQHHLYPIIFSSRAILLGFLALLKLMYLV